MRAFCVVFVNGFLCFWVLFRSSSVLRACRLRALRGRRFIACFLFSYFLDRVFFLIPLAGCVFVYLPFFHCFLFCSIFVGFILWTISVKPYCPNPLELRRLTQATVLPGILNNLGKDAVNSVQFLPGESFRASFSTPEHKVRVENRGPFTVSGLMSASFWPPAPLRWMFTCTTIHLRNQMRKFVALSPNLVQLKI